MISSTQPAFALVRAWLTLSGVALVSLGAAAALASALTTEPGTLPAVLFAGGVAWAASLVGLVPVALLGHHGVQATINAYFAGMAGRILVCIMAGVLGALAVDFRLEPLLLGMAGMYLPLLFVEVGLIAAYLSRKDAPGLTAAGPDATQPHKEAMA